MIRFSENKDIENILSVAKDSEYISLSENALKNYIEDKYHKVVICENDSGETVGLLIFSFIFPEAEIIDIVILSKYKRIGVGSNLLNYLISFLKENNGKKIILEVNSDNKSACDFYKHFGFKEDGIRKNYYTCPKTADAILMSFDLF